MKARRDATRDGGVTRGETRGERWREVARRVARGGERKKGGAARNAAKATRQQGDAWQRRDATRGRDRCDA